ncbi:hypothetical protein M2140_000279 [Clostridiales Family XIII bacterium PM5-7]
MPLVLFCLRAHALLKNAKVSYRNVRIPSTAVFGVFLRAYGGFWSNCPGKSQYFPNKKGRTAVLQSSLSFKLLSEPINPISDLIFGKIWQFYLLPTRNISGQVTAEQVVSGFPLTNRLMANIYERILRFFYGFLRKSPYQIFYFRNTAVTQKKRQGARHPNIYYKAIWGG